jgi:hypothetical protein
VKTPSYLAEVFLLLGRLGADNRVGENSLLPGRIAEDDEGVGEKSLLLGRTAEDDEGTDEESLLPGGIAEVDEGTGEKSLLLGRTAEDDEGTDEESLLPGGIAEVDEGTGEKSLLPGRITEDDEGTGERHAEGEQEAGPPGAHPLRGARGQPCTHTVHSENPSLSLAWSSLFSDWWNHVWHLSCSRGQCGWRGTLLPPRTRWLDLNLYCTVHANDN